MPEALPEKRERYYTVGGSGELHDYTAVALFEGQDGKREAVIGITLKNIPEVSGFVAFIAEKFCGEHKLQPAMLELPMIYWKGGTLEDEVLVTQAVNQWIDHNKDPCEYFYDCLDDFEYESFYSEYEEALKNPLKTISKNQLRAPKKADKGFS